MKKIKLGLGGALMLSAMLISDKTSVFSFPSCYRLEDSVSIWTPCQSNLYRANGTDAENHASALSEGGIHGGAEGFDVGSGNKGLDCARKATAMHAPCGFFTGELTLRKAKS